MRQAVLFIYLFITLYVFVRAFSHGTPLFTHCDTRSALQIFSILSLNKPHWLGAQRAK
jgi:hypothetical protein